MYHRVIRSCSVEFDVTLTLSIVRSLFTGNVLKLWRMTDLCPIFKQGSKLWDSNYRPVSLKSVVSKLTISFVREEKMDSRSQLFQRASMALSIKKSCITNLLEALDIMAIY